MTGHRNSEVTEDVAGHSCFSSHMVKGCPNPRLISAIFCISVLLAGDFTVLKGPAHTVAVLSSTPEGSSLGCALQRKQMR